MFLSSNIITIYHGSRVGPNLGVAKVEYSDYTRPWQCTILDFRHSKFNSNLNIVTTISTNSNIITTIVTPY